MRPFAKLLRTLDKYYETSIRCCVYEECSLKSFNVEKLRHDNERSEWSRSRDGGDHDSRCLTVPVGRVTPAVNCVSSELLGSRWLAVSSYKHLLMKYESLGVGKSVAAADCRRAPIVETEKEVDLITTTSSRHRHMLLDLQPRRRLRTRTYRPTDNSK